MQNIRFTVVTLSILLTACRSSSPISTGTSAPIQPAELPTSIPVTSATSWQISPVTALRRYQVSTTAILETSGVRDSVRSEITLSVSQQALETTGLVSGTIDNFAMQPGSHIGPPAITPQLPSAFSGNLRQSELRLEQNVDCNTQFPVAAVIQKIVWNLPRELRLGQSWTDSSTIPSCNGNIPVTLKTVRTYRVAGEDKSAGAQRLLITRIDRIRSAGEGSQEQHQVRTSSSSTGTVNLWIDLQNGSLLRSVAEYSGTVTVTASGRSQTFAQHLHETVEQVH